MLYIYTTYYTKIIPLDISYLTIIDLNVIIRKHKIVKQNKSDKFG
jgi:hypothetical protein